jgi:hypothetical protein
MKRFSLLAALWLGAALSAFAAAGADHPLSVSAGGEMNRFSRYDWSPGANVLLDYKLDEVLSLGLKGGYSLTPGTEEWETINTVEAALIERFYLVNWGWGRLYFQGNMGAVILREEDFQAVRALGSGTVGFRLFFKYWFVDLYGSYGYPMQYDGGLLLGHSFIP